MNNPELFEAIEVLLYWDSPLLILVKDKQQNKYLMLRADQEEIWYIKITSEEAEKLKADLKNCNSMFKNSDIVYTFNINDDQIKVLERSPNELEFDYSDYNIKACQMAGFRAPSSKNKCQAFFDKAYM